MRTLKNLYLEFRSLGMLADCAISAARQLLHPAFARISPADYFGIVKGSTRRPRVYYSERQWNQELRAQSRHCNYLDC